MWHPLCLLCLCCCCRRNMLNKKAKSNQGENATLPPWGLCHLYFADNGEKSNENKWVVLCCRALLLEGIWLTNDNNTSWNSLYWNKITRKKAWAGKKNSWMCRSQTRAIREDRRRKNTSDGTSMDTVSLSLPRLTQLAAVYLGHPSEYKKKTKEKHPNRRYTEQSNQVKLLQQPDSSAASPNSQMIL